MADIPLTNEIHQKWEPAAKSAASIGRFSFTVFHVWPHIFDTGLLERDLSMYCVIWDVSATQTEVVSTCKGHYRSKKHGREVFYHAPKTAACFAKALIAARLPHIVEEGEVSAFLPAAEAQFADLTFLAMSTGLPLSLVCSLIVRHLGDKHHAAMYAKSELMGN